jgi:methyl-accepting chemotaxis protein
MLRLIGLKNYILSSIIIIVVLSIASAVFTIVQTDKNVHKSNGNAINATVIISLATDMSAINSALPAIIMEEDPDKLENSLAKLQEKISEVNNDIIRCGVTCSDLKDNFSHYEKNLKILVDTKILVGKKSEAIEFFIQELSPIYKSSLAIIDSKGAAVQKATVEAVEQTLIEAKKIKLSLMASSALVIFIIGLGGYYFRKTLINCLNNVAIKLEASTLTLKSTSQKISSTSDILTESSNEQKISIEGTSQAVQEISAMTDTNRHSVEVSAQNSMRSLDKITNGKEIMNHMLITINQIEQTNEMMIEQIKQNESQFNSVATLISEINAKTQLIDDIVFQTKILSFNASVEAARAGDQGKGFAVVAEEVGNLANMSSAASKEISDLLTKSNNHVLKILDSSRTSMDKHINQSKSIIAQSQSIVLDCNQIFNDIDLSSQSINDVLVEINAGTEEQSKGIQEVNRAMLIINEVAHKSTQLAEESLITSSELNKQSISISEIVSDLACILNGKRTEKKQLAS